MVYGDITDGDKKSMIDNNLNNITSLIILKFGSLVGDSDEKILIFLKWGNNLSNIENNIELLNNFINDNKISGLEIDSENYIKLKSYYDSVFTIDRQLALYNSNIVDVTDDEKLENFSFNIRIFLIKIFGHRGNN
ncbi:MAG: hypothetical protein HRU03_04950 [Nanoarchaeales archaeon]|nr:hypothetical protein [Nanoarchaeales archaeon]